MTPKQRAVIERARKSEARFVHIDPKEGRIYRETAYENHFGKLFNKSVLETEQQRLIRTWEEDSK